MLPRRADICDLGGRIAR